MRAPLIVAGLFVFKKIMASITCNLLTIKPNSYTYFSIQSKAKYGSSIFILDSGVTILLQYHHVYV